MSGFGGTVAQHNYGVTEIGLETPQGIEHVRVLITEEIVEPLDHSGYSQFKSHPRLQGLTLANDFEEDKFVVDILSGADAAYRFLGEIIQDNSQPLIQESHFGDVLYGPWPQNAMLTTAIIGNHAIKDSEVVTKYIDVLCEDDDASQNVSFQNLVDNESLLIQVDRLFQGQFVSDPENDKPENNFLHGYRKQIEFRDGQYFTPLPWKKNHSPLPSNLELCKKRLDQVTARLTKLNLMDTYRKVMAEHLSKGYIEELRDLDESWPEEGCRYLPHFFVLKDSETTPLRIVFAANACKVSLNDFTLAVSSQ